MTPHAHTLTSSSFDEEWVRQHFDPNDAQRLVDPYPAYEFLRDQCPVAQSDAHEDGFWILSRYEHVRAALSNFHAFASGPSVSLPGRDMPLLPVEANPPRHLVLRRFVNGPFSPRVVAEHEEAMRANVVGILDDLVRRGEADLMSEFAFPVSANALFSPGLLGEPLPVGEGSEPEADWVPAVHRLVRDQKHVATESSAAGATITAYLERLLDARDAEPQDDIPSYLAAAIRSGDTVDRQEAIGILAGLFTGGIETPASAIAVILLFLARHPEHTARLREQPELIPEAIEELLRAFGPSQGVRRTLTQDVEVDGRLLRKGDTVWLALNAADRDEREFECPDDVRWDRSPNRHLGWGLGPHRCIGIHLARLLLRVVVEEFVARTRAVRVLKDDSELQWWMSTGRVVGSLPVAFADSEPHANLPEASA